MLATIQPAQADLRAPCRSKCVDHGVALCMGQAFGFTLGFSFGHSRFVPSGGGGGGNAWVDESANAWVDESANPWTDS